MAALAPAMLLLQVVAVEPVVMETTLNPVHLAAVVVELTALVLMEQQIPVDQVKEHPVLAAQFI
jgi:hypothetical protein